jgi:hypothetical protein
MKSWSCYQSTGQFLLLDVGPHSSYSASIPELNNILDSTSTTFQPFFLDFYKVHSLATHFFLRMWSESGAAFGDFTRVVALVRSQYVSLFSSVVHCDA